VGHPQGIFTAAGHVDGMTFLAEPAGQQLCQPLLILDHE